MFITKKRYNKEIEDAYIQGNSDATLAWKKEFTSYREYIQNKLIVLRESVKKTTKTKLIDNINDIIQ